MKSIDDIIHAGEQTTGGQFAGRWDYTYPSGEFAFAVLRFSLPGGDKTMRPVHQTGEGWKFGDPPGLAKLPLYRVRDLGQGVRVYVVEGEKKVDAAASIGLTATTSAHGAKSAAKSEWRPLAGREVVILPDNDDAGRGYAEDVGRIVSRLEPFALVKMVPLPGVPESGDIVDWLAEHDGQESDALRAEIERMADEATYWRPPLADAAECDSYLSDIGNAARLVRRFGRDVRYCGPRGQWFLFDERRFQPDDELRIERLAKTTALSIFDEARDCKDQKRQQALADWAVNSQRREKLRSMIDLARCEVPVRPDALDSDPMLFNVLNGTVDLRTVELRPHDRNDLITRLAPVRYDPKATCPRFMQFLDEIIDGNADTIGYLQRLFGMALTGDVREHILAVFFGTGANGKTTCLDTVSGLMGDYAGMAAPSLLTVKHNDEHPCELADLCGRRLIVASESDEGGRLRVQLVKRLTGDTMLKARFMRQDYFEFRRQFKLVLCTNNKPRVPEATTAIWRRVKLIPFNVTFAPDKQDADLLAKLRAEWSGILNWAVEGCRQWQATGLGEPAEVTQATREYEADQDVLAEFIETCCVVSRDAVVTRRELYAAYQTWAEGMKERYPLDRKQFFERIRHRSGVEEVRRRMAGAPEYVFVGIAIATTGCEVREGQND